jgi:NAD(P)-dependent dehydrogenase (short-subunit alcohol dehydrogenase family)
MSKTQQPGAVLITGTSSGIGRETALHLDQLGFRVFATVRKQADAAALRSQASERLCPIILDVTDQASINLARDEVAQSIGEDGLVGLVNNAGVGFTSPLEFVPLKDLRWLFEVNVFGVLAVTQAFLPLLRQARGRIVNVSSTASLVVAPFHGPYSASKLSLNGLSNALRLELRPQGLQVSVVVCGSIRTPMWEKGGDLSDQVSQNYPPQAWQLYGSAYGKLRDYFSRLGRSGVPPEAAARAIAHALTAKRARNTYFVGPDARLYNIASKLVYGRLRDWVVMRSIGLSDNA